MDGLDVCSSATHVMLQHNWIRHIDGLEFFDKIQYLVLNNNRLETLSGVSHLGTLQYLDVSHNQIATVEVGEVPDKLMALELKGNPCSELPGYRASLIGSLPNLVFLDEERISLRERRVARGEEGGDDEDDDDDDDDEEGEEEDEVDEGDGDGGHSTGTGTAEGHPSHFLSDAKASVSRPKELDAAKAAVEAG